MVADEEGRGEWTWGSKGRQACKGRRTKRHTATLPWVLAPSPQTSVSADKKSFTAGAGLSNVMLLAALHDANVSADAAIPHGVCSFVGIPGWNLGGGFGRLGRYLGLGCDNVEALEMVLANGTVVEATASACCPGCFAARERPPACLEHPSRPALPPSRHLTLRPLHFSGAANNSDLLWASCGGGGGTLGTVTKLQFKISELPKGGMTLVKARTLTHLQMHACLPALLAPALPASVALLLAGCPACASLSCASLQSPVRRSTGRRAWTTRRPRCSASWARCPRWTSALGSPLTWPRPATASPVSSWARPRRLCRCWRPPACWRTWTPAASTAR